MATSPGLKLAVEAVRQAPGSSQSCREEWDWPLRVAGAGLGTRCVQSHKASRMAEEPRALLNPEIQGRAVPAPSLTLFYLFRKYSRAVLETLKTQS